MLSIFSCTSFQSSKLVAVYGIKTGLSTAAVWRIVQHRSRAERDSLLFRGRSCWAAFSIHVHAKPELAQHIGVSQRSLVPRLAQTLHWPQYTHAHSRRWYYLGVQLSTVKNCEIAQVFLQTYGHSRQRTEYRRQKYGPKYKNKYGLMCGLVFRVP